MRRLEPGAEADLAEAYAYPAATPWLRANMVAAADGAAWLDGRTGGLGNATDQRLMSLLRGLSDVVIVGANTVRVEGYRSISPRPWWGGIRDGREPAPPLAIVSGSLALDFEAPVFTEAIARTIVITCEAAPEERRHAAAKRADVIVAGDELVDVATALDALAERGHPRQLTEGGPLLLARIAAAGRLDELCLTLSPQIVAGDAARILNGPALPSPLRLRPRHVLAGEGALFLRYERADPSEEAP